MNQADLSPLKDLGCAARAAIRRKQFITPLRLCEIVQICEGIRAGPSFENRQGFELVRADELFNTGTVVEQIREQIEKSTLLVADLSSKNPNVFYELGLAHAAKKPAVFTQKLLMYHSTSGIFGDHLRYPSTRMGDQISGKHGRLSAQYCEVHSIFLPKDRRRMKSCGSRS